MGRTCGRRAAYWDFGEETLGRPRRRWEDNIKMHLQEVGWRGMDRITLAQVAGSCESGDETLGSIKCRKFLDCLGTWLLKKDCAAWSSFVGLVFLGIVK
jgi:hypothetical protein